MSARKGLPRTAVIGAGAGGLVAARCLLEVGIEPHVFESGPDIGGLWRYDEAIEGGGGPAYRSLETNTSKQVMAFSELPFPESAPDFPSRADVLEYLCEYAQRFDLRRHVRCNTVVEAVTPQDDRRWSLRLRRGESTFDDVFDVVVVCSGRHQHHELPGIPGIDDHQGTLLHSSAYTRPEPFEHQSVVVVGVGSSGVDIAVELSSVARRVILSTSRGGWFVPRYLGGRPYDHRMTRLGSLLPSAVRRRALERLILDQYHESGIEGDLETLGMPSPEFDLYRTRLTPSSTLLDRVASGAILVRPDISRLARWQAVFEDGRRMDADAVVFATGYRTHYPFLERSLLDTSGDDLELYRFVFHPHRPSLIFIGACIVTGPYPPVLELQARWVAHVLVGDATLPPASVMSAAISRRRARQKKLGSPPMRVQPMEYMDTLAGEIGARPRLLRHPLLLRHLLAGPLTAAQYRLDGPGRWKGAADAIRRARRQPSGEKSRR